MTDEEIKQRLNLQFDVMRLWCAGRQDDLHRWSSTDLATDLVEVVRNVFLAGRASGIAEERHRVLTMLATPTATDDDGNLLHDLGNWQGEWFVLDPTKVISAICTGLSK